VKNYLINQIDCLLKGESVTMLLGGEKFVIHKLSEPCDLNAEEGGPEQNNTHFHPAKDFVAEMYPKQKYMPYIINTLVKKNLIHEDLYFIDFPDLHLADVCTFFNNRFGKHESTPVKLIKLCKYLQQNDIRFPIVSIKNPVAKKYVC
jgi:hypothetical protein